MMLSGRTQEREIYARLDTASPSQLGGLILGAASERVRAKFSFSCSSASAQLADIERWTLDAISVGQFESRSLVWGRKADRSIFQDPQRAITLVPLLPQSSRPVRLTPCTDAHQRSGQG